MATARMKIQYWRTWLGLMENQLDRSIGPLTQILICKGNCIILKEFKILHMDHLLI